MGINVDVVENVPNWAATYLMYRDDSGLEREEREMVDRWVKGLESDGLRLVAPIDGSENEFCHCPAFGGACDVQDWSAECR